MTTTRDAEIAALGAVREKVRAAVGRDRKLDVRILAHLQQPGEWSADDIEYACRNPERTCSPPEYTDSIDAALALVERVLPAGWWVQLRVGSDFQAEAWCERPSRLSVQHGGETPALAILAALLSAKIVLLQKDPSDGQ